MINQISTTTNNRSKAKKDIMKILLFLSLFLFTGSQTQAQGPSKQITIVSDESIDMNNLNKFDSILVEEIRSLLSVRYSPKFKILGGEFDAKTIEQHFQEAWSDPETDIVIGTGIISCAILAKQKRFLKPTIAAVVIPEQLSSPPVGDSTSSGIENFNYVISPFDLVENFTALYDYRPYKKVAVLLGEEFVDIDASLTLSTKPLMDSLGVSLEIISYTNDVASTLKKIPKNTGSVLLLPMTDQLSKEEMNTLLLEFQNRQIPSIALQGEDLVTKGAFMGFESEHNLKSIPRRIAIQVSKSLDGAALQDLPVRIESFNNNLVINMEAARRSGVYPSFDFMSNAVLINLSNAISDRTLNIEGAIIEGLQQSLDYQAAKKNPELQNFEVGLAKSEYRPQLDVNTTLTAIDATRAETSFGAQGRVNWLASASLSQIVYAEPALANIAIQELLLKSEEQSTLEIRLNVIIDVAEAFLTVLQTQSFLKIQNQNLQRTRENYDISQSKQAIGYVGQSDLNRWKSELANANIDLNKAQANVQSSKFRLNQLLNRPINEEFTAIETSLNDDVLTLLNTEIVPLISNTGLVEKFTNFMVSEALVNLPELKQIDYGIASQRRLLLSQKRAFYLPTVALQGGLDYIVKRFATTELAPEIAMLGLANTDNIPQWNMSLAVSYPILQGKRRELNADKTKLNILQLEDQRGSAANQLELLVRTNLQTLAASGATVQLSRTSAEAAVANYEIVKDNYAQGIGTVTNLVDAQNAAIQSELSTANADYQFILDYLILERSIGHYNFLASAEKQNAFVDRLKVFLVTN